MPVFLTSGLLSLVLIVVFMICFLIACISVEKIKNESIRMREDSVQSCSQFDVKKIIGFPFCHAAIFNNACCLASDSALI